MSKQRRIKGEGQGVSLTVWLSEAVHDAIDQEASRLKTTRSTIARQALEAKFGTKTTKV